MSALRADFPAIDFGDPCIPYIRRRGASLALFHSLEAPEGFRRSTIYDSAPRVRTGYSRTANSAILLRAHVQDHSSARAGAPRDGHLAETLTGSHRRSLSWRDPFQPRWRPRLTCVMLGS